MDWKGALRARLLAALPVTTLVADYTPQGGLPTKAIFWADRPQSSTLPAITLQRIFEARSQHMTGLVGLDQANVQIDVWGTSYSQVQQIAEAVIAALLPEQAGNGVKFSRAFIDSTTDRGERVETQFIHRAQIDFIIHHATA